jgi:lipopolysaccharide transport system permease protein
VYVGLVPWTFFANAISLASNSLIGSEQMVRKTYFPRLLLPLGATAALGLDMLVSLIFMALLMLYYRFPLTPAIWALPGFILGAVLTASGLGFFLAALNVRYRDIKYVVPFFTQMAFFVTPIIYPLRSVPGKMATIMALNPMAGIIEGWRYAVLGYPVSASFVELSFAASAVLFVAGLFFFRRMERTFADVI